MKIELCKENCKHLLFEEDDVAGFCLFFDNYVEDIEEYCDLATKESACELH